MSELDPRTPPDPPLAGWPRPLAFVLSGGGALGSTQVGMLRALSEHGVRPDLVVGSSVGALHGALVAADVDRASDALADMWRSMDRRVLFGRRRAVVRNLRRSKSLADPANLTRLIEQHLPVAGFEDLDIPFAAVATDGLTGAPELLRSGRLTPALLASAAVPGVFPPVEVEGRLYVDGGVAANVPIRQAIAFGARSMVSLDATPSLVASEMPRSPVANLLHSASLMLRSQSAHAVDELTHRYRIASMPLTTPPDMGTFNFGRTEELMEAGYRAGVDYLNGRLSDSEESRIQTRKN